MKKLKLTLVAFVTAAGISAPFAATQVQAADQTTINASLQSMTLSEQQFIQDIAKKSAGVTTKI
ncbi:hypothetical protein MFLO_15453 [Listeria floridensis FSL S10-1187]|uniref:Uncharacterized protein n=1 Tax=Listeria floridensis FSL S10-1187 TaxID=1265817 RepID=A0ABN0RBE6_9LIST|nr:hypothetical protein [Listeria floridensis]EUJ25388.1 hypothetical protein MFLO_15453 [Listeria floridensis FSL S10-1187]